MNGRPFVNVYIIFTSYLCVLFCLTEVIDTAPCDLDNLIGEYGTSKFLGDVFSNGGNNSRLTMVQFQKLLVGIGIGQVYLECKSGERREDCIAREKKAIVDADGKHSRQRKDVTDPFVSINHTNHLDKHFKTCFEGKKILELHKLNYTEPGITKEQFLQICPSLISQLKSHTCQHLHSDFKFVSISSKLRKMLPPLAVWGYGALSVLVISLLSLIVIAMIPCLGKAYYHMIMAYLVALAVGCLSGDAILHLIPHSFAGEHHEDHSEHLMRVWKSMFVLLGIYIFFTVEQLMKSNVFCCMRGHSHGGIETQSDELPNHHHLGNVENADLMHSSKGAPFSPEVVYHYKSDKQKDDEEEKSPASHCASNEALAPPSESSESNATPTHTHGRVMSCESDLHEYNHDHVSNKQGGHYHADDRHHHHHHGHKEITKDTAISSVAWMVIVGDGFHNFSDGLAIGAAYATSLTSGFGTSIAVLCHELPHELGDFAVLLKSGMSVKQALVYNVVSAILSFLGLAVGIAVGNSALGRQFILAMTAGLFLYVSLADMLPELTSQEIPNQSRLASYVFQHVGILSGIGIMLLISIYEEDF